MSTLKLSSVHKLLLLAFGMAVLASGVFLAKRRSVACPMEWREPVTEMEFRLIPAGSFMMGSPPTEAEREPQEAFHRAEIPRAFYLGKFEVTQGEWRQVMETNPSHFSDCGRRCPVERVNFHQVQEFIARLEKLSGGARFRLPTEAEWEYACRAGTTTPFNTGATLSTDQANYNGDFSYAGQPRGNNRQRTMPVGSFAPNAWGLYDMHGNVWEWCEDWYCPQWNGQPMNSEDSCHTGFKVIRGGSWAFNAQSARSALRYTHRPQDLGYSLGFRLVRELPTNPH